MKLEEPKTVRKIFGLIDWIVFFVGVIGYGAIENPDIGGFYICSLISFYMLAAYYAFRIFQMIKNR